MEPVADARRGTYLDRPDAARLATLVAKGKKKNERPGPMSRMALQSAASTVLPGCDTPSQSVFVPPLLRAMAMELSLCALPRDGLSKYLRAKEL